MLHLFHLAALDERPVKWHMELRLPLGDRPWGVLPWPLLPWPPRLLFWGDSLKREPQ